jgi:outer membrane phospholipase A
MDYPRLFWYQISDNSPSAVCRAINNTREWNIMQWGIQYRAEYEKRLEMSQKGVKHRHKNLPHSPSPPARGEASRLIIVRDSHGGGWSRKINAWHLYTLMVYL